MADGWASHLVGADVLGEGTLPGQLDRFLTWQTAQWPRLAEALAALGGAEQRPLTVGDRTLTLQWNPGRTTSSTAKVDAASVQQRKCFLCADSLPPEEHGVAFGDDLVVLPNPAPILPGHLVAAHREHVPQAVREALEPAAALRRRHGGALHRRLQRAEVRGVGARPCTCRRCTRAAPRGAGGLRGAVARSGARRAPPRAPEVQVWSARGAGRGGDRGPRGAGSGGGGGARRPGRAGRREPMVNVLATARGSGVVAMLFRARRTARPASSPRGTRSGW
ncbi:MAG: DUF4922 domain-containing protein [Myxococcota bacterium]